MALSKSPTSLEPSPLNGCSGWDSDFPPRGVENKKRNADMEDKAKEVFEVMDGVAVASQTLGSLNQDALEVLGGSSTEREPRIPSSTESATEQNSSAR